MTLYSGMNNTSGKAITDIDHLRHPIHYHGEHRHRGYGLHGR